MIMTGRPQGLDYVRGKVALDPKVCAKSRVHLIEIHLSGCA